MTGRHNNSGYREISGKFGTTVINESRAGYSIVGSDFSPHAGLDVTDVIIRATDTTLRPLMRTLQTITIIVAATVLCSCRTDTEQHTNPDAPGSGKGIVAGSLEVSVNKAARTFTVRNTTEFVVGYLAVERDVTTAALFPPCGENCAKIAQAQSKTIDFSEIVGYTPEAREARILWWTYVRDRDDVLRPQGSVQTTIVHID